MNIRYTMAIVGIAAGIGGLVLPVLAQTRDDARDIPDRRMGQTEAGRMGHGMMSGNGMMGGMMSGGRGCMAQSMNGGDHPPNSQWQTHRGGDATPD